MHHTRQTQRPDLLIICFQIPPPGVHQAHLCRGHLLPRADRAKRGDRLRRGEHQGPVEVCAGVHGERKGRRIRPSKNLEIRSTLVPFLRSAIEDYFIECVLYMDERELKKDYDECKKKTCKIFNPVQFITLHILVTVKLHVALMSYCSHGILC